MRLLYVDDSKIAKYKKGGWVVKSAVKCTEGIRGALMLKLETVEEFEGWDFENKCVRTQRH